MSEFFNAIDAQDEENIRRQAMMICDALYNKKAQDIEGYSEGRWIVIDFGSILVHIFYPEEREYYNMERLWVDDPRGFVDYSKLMLEKEREKELRRRAAEKGE